MTTPTQTKPVFVDVYAWLAAIATHKQLVMEGVFRHAEALSRLYSPAVYLPAGDDVTPESVAQLEDYLGKRIHFFRSVEAISQLQPAAWISPAVDFPAPFLHLKVPFKKVAILHDTLAKEGYFGPEKVKQYRYGAQNNDALAYVSVYSLSQYCRHVKVRPKQDFIRYGCFHEYESLPQVGVSRDARFLAVHSLYTRKNVPAEAELAHKLGGALTHAGRRFNEVPESQLEDLQTRFGARFLGPVSEALLEILYATSQNFVCLSQEEGFSMPPMEAILLGIPTIYLSAIPVHKEIYGDFNVNFVGTDLSALPQQPKTISEADRKALFSLYRKDRVLLELRQYLAQI